jgi:hypothetical protein
MTPEKAFAAIIADLKEQLKAELLEELREELDLTLDEDIGFEEAREELNMSEYTLRQLVRTKQIPHRTVGCEGSRRPKYIFNRRSLKIWKRKQEEANYRPREVMAR